MLVKPLSQIDTIRSLSEALTWFQRELSWGVAPSALPHLTGRIGELFAAVTLNGDMATAVNQRGYDVLLRETNLRVSVKTITSSSHVSFNPRTFDQVDRVFILRIAVDGDEVTLNTVLDETAERTRTQCTVDGSGNYVFAIRRTAVVRKLDLSDVSNEAMYDRFLIRQYANGTITVESDGFPTTSAMAVLRDIAAAIGVSLVNSNDNPRNTRQLGAEVIAALKARDESSSD